jgi:hypothetical protein
LAIRKKQCYEPAERHADEQRVQCKQSVFAHHVARCPCPNTLATVGGNGCSTQVTGR